MALEQRALSKELRGWGDKPLIAKCNTVPGLKLFSQMP